MREDDIGLRLATVADAGAVCAFHVRLWCDTYAGIAPPAALASLNADRRLPKWVATLQNGPPQQGTVIAQVGGQVVGLVSYGPPSHAAFGTRGEVAHLYVDASYRRAGVGRRLLRAGFTGLATAGYQGFALAVVRQNSPARGFYRATGGHEAGGFIDPGPIWQSDNIVVIWDQADLPPA